MFLIYRRPIEFLAQHGDSDVLVQLIIMIIIMAFAVIGNILKARSETRPKKVNKPPVRNHHKPTPQSQEDLTAAQQLPEYQQKKIPSLTISPGDIRRYPRRRQRHPVKGPVIAAQSLPEEESMELKQEPVFPQHTSTKELKHSIFKLHPDNLRQAVLFHEILGRPLSLRDIDDRPF